MEYVVWALSVIIALFVGGYLKSYMSKKGENLATKEDIAQLTRITKEIEHVVSTKAWTRQIKKEIAIEILKAIGLVRVTALPVSSKNTPDEQRGHAISEYQSAIFALVQYNMVVLLAFDADVDRAVREIVKNSLELTGQIAGGGDAGELGKALDQQCKDIAARFQSELGI
jgi:hypothetical protein